MEPNSKMALPRQFSLIKDLSGKFLFVCENMAEISGSDSPAKMIGMSDFDLIWKDQAEYYRQGDFHTIRGKFSLSHVESIRFIHEPNKLRKICTTKAPLRNQQDQIIGVIASFIDITGLHLIRGQGCFNSTGEKFTLNDGLFAGITFSKKQITLLQYLIMGYSAADIACLLNRSKRTIEGHVEHLKNKLQCTSKAELIRCVVTSGLLHGLDWPMKQKI